MWDDGDNESLSLKTFYRPVSRRYHMHMPIFTPNIQCEGCLEVLSVPVLMGRSAEAQLV